MEAGKLSQRVTFERPVVSSASLTGAKTVTWETVCRRWVQITTQIGQFAYFQGGQKQSEATHKVTGRDFGGANASWRINWGGRYLYLATVRQPDPRKPEYEAFAKEDLL